MWGRTTGETEADKMTRTCGFCECSFWNPSHQYQPSTSIPTPSISWLQQRKTGNPFLLVGAVDTAYNLEPRSMLPMASLYPNISSNRPHPCHHDNCHLLSSGCHGLHKLLLPILVPPLITADVPTIEGEQPSVWFCLGLRGSWGSVWDLHH